MLIPANDRFLRACRRQPVDRPPLWIMRQAGRYLPEYRALRRQVTFLELCQIPELAVEASLQPLRRFPLDAAILFSDILVPLQAAGMPMTFDPGPRLELPFRVSEIDRWTPPPMSEAAPYVGRALGMLKREIGGRIPVLGFAGAPWTLAAYLLEGEGREGFPAAKGLLYQDPALLARLLDKLADLVADHLAYQLSAGADAVQIFDSAASVLSPEDYFRVALPALRRVMSQLPKERGPVIYFAPGAPHLLDDAASTRADVIGLCWRSSLRVARRRLDGVALQGNLDPSALLAPPAALRARALEVLEAGRGPGHIMNLGHGILEGTPLAAVETLVETVASFRNESRGVAEPVTSGGERP
jgi:uroporphyrinogen decarboxylase